MKPIFLSLGSEYSPVVLRAFWRALFSPQNVFQTTHELDQALAELFPKLTERAYTRFGRDAIEVALRAMQIGKGDQVITQAFSCQAVPRAIERAGAEAVFVDIAVETMNPTVSTLTEAHRRATRAKAVIIQHTLGLPADISAIKKWCQEHKLICIEDLAQAYGGSDITGVPLGSTADAVILSFGKNKVLDATGGGACLLNPLVIKDAAYLDSFRLFSHEGMPFSKKLYPFVTACIRSSYSIGLGKIIAAVARRLGILASPVIEDKPFAQTCPALYGEWAQVHLQRLATQLAHRRIIAGVYAQAFPTSMRGNKDQYTQGSCLRFVLSVSEPAKLIAFCKKKQLYIADRWYRQPVDSGSLQYAHGYLLGSCPTAELLTQTTVNLPTHECVTPQLAQQIVQIIKAFGIER
ncbi:DegT/DnrJ/EryC1/StrS aminotransferase family protein [Candidatus Woesebacteria bacterium]|nr:DegT/DnrJ/EryC1/StrS aminotransferase family protein [Candidatus Woesebacteria bacterium]